MENTVDVDDIGGVLDLYFHRLVQLHVEEGLPLSAIPVPMSARLARLLAEGMLPGRSVSA